MNKGRKQFADLLIAAVLIGGVALAGCGGSSGSSGNTGSNNGSNTGTSTGGSGGTGTGDTGAGGTGGATSFCGTSGGQPSVTLQTPSANAGYLSGYACNVDTTKYKIVVYVLTNEWWVQPYASAPFTNIAGDGLWGTSTNPWTSIVVLLVDPAKYTAQSTAITNPVFDPGVVAWTIYPSQPVSVNLSGYTWGIKMTGNVATDQFDPGPNFWSNDPSVVSADSGGLHLNVKKVGGNWQSAEVYLTKSLGYGTYTVQVNSRLDQLDQKIVASPLFIYVGVNKEEDNEYSGMGGLIPAPNDAQFVMQPYNVPGNMVRYVQPAVAQFTTQMEWRADHVTFRSWTGWASTPPAGSIIYQWTYTGTYIPAAGAERVHINLWLLNGSAPVNGTGASMTINAFSFQP